METPAPLRTWPRLLAVSASLCAVPVALVYLHLAVGVAGYEGLRSLIVAFAVEPTVVALLAAVAIVAWASLASTRRVSPVLPLAAAVLPWLVGSAMSVVRAAGMSEPPRWSLSWFSAVYGAMAARLTGASASAALLGCLAAAAAWNAHAPVAERRRLAGRTRRLGLGVALCGGAISLCAIVLYPRSHNSVAALLSVTGLVWVLLIGHTARTTDEAGSRVATLVVTATGAAALQAWAAIALVAQSLGLSMYGALGRVEPGGREAALDASIDELTMTLAGGTAVALATTVGAAAFAMWTSREIPEARRALWICATVLAVTIGVDVATALGARAMIAGFDPWIAKLIVP